jgi:predicted transcriptional regulator
MGSVSIDIEKGSRQYSVKYALNTPKGVQRLLRDVHALRSRRFDAGDYDACDILIDLDEAIKLAKLTHRQRQVMALIVERDMTQEDAGKVLGVGQDAVSYCLKGAIRRITEVYRKWEYGEVVIQLDEEIDNIFIPEDIDEEMEREERYVRKEMIKSGVPIIKERCYLE